MIFGVKALFAFVCGVSICFAIGAETHPVFAAPAAVIFFWAMLSSYNPERFADFEMEALYSIVISLGTAVVVYMCI